MAEHCYQRDHPAQQTYCFEQGRGTPCSDAVCLVYQAIVNKSGLLRMFQDPRDKQSYIECYYLHKVCRMSNSSPRNGEFKKRISQRE